MKKKIIILASFVITFFTACTSTHMITFSNAELSDKEKDMIENNSNYSTMEEVLLPFLVPVFVFGFYEIIFYLCIGQMEVCKCFCE